MLPDRVSNPGPLTYESGALPIALRGPAECTESSCLNFSVASLLNMGQLLEERICSSRNKLTPLRVDQLLEGFDGEAKVVSLCSNGESIEIYPFTINTLK